jgi:hypothetical protein
MEFGYASKGLQGIFGTISTSNRFGEFKGTERFAFDFRTRLNEHGQNAPR